MLLRMLAALAALFTLAWGGLCLAQGDTAAEYRIKAAFLYKFSGYVEWPEQSFARPDSPIVIGVAGADTLADELAQIVAGRTVNGRPLAVKKVRRQDPLTGLNVLFIGRGEAARGTELLGAARGLALLTVTEQDEERGRGMINFVLVDDKVRFDIDLEPAEQAGIKISSRLLTVARKVSTKPS